MSLLFFLFQVIGVSLSGVMAPGPVTAAAISMGQRQRFAGTLIALGHAIIELPLMLLIMFGMEKIFESTKVQVAIGLAGGALLLIMGGQMLVSLKTADNPQVKGTKTKPVLTGLILSASNPYFLVWWATVGIKIASPARQWGIWGFALFAVAHWLCDFVWLQVLSWASFKGSTLLGSRGRRVILMFCSLALLLFGLMFIYNAANNLFKLF